MHHSHSLSDVTEGVGVTFDTADAAQTLFRWTIDGQCVHDSWGLCTLVQLLPSGHNVCEHMSHWTCILNT